MEWMLLPFKRYAEFGGRSRRKEYWMFVLFTLLVNIGFFVLLLLVGGSAAVFGADRFGSSLGGPLAMGGIAAVISLANLIFSLVILIPSLAVAVRRLHDTNRSGWWLLVPIGLYAIGFALMLGGALSAIGGGVSGNAGGATAVIGGILLFAGFISAIVLLVFFCLPGTTGPNRFGPDPKNPDGDLQQVFS